MQRDNPNSLSTQEAQYLKELLEKEPKAIADKLKAFIKSDTKLTLAMRFALNDQIIHDICASDDFKEEWLAVWERCGQSTFAAMNPNLTTEVPASYAFMPQPNLSCFELVKGIDRYWHYCNTEDTAALTQSAEFGCYFAFNELCAKIIASLSQAKNKYEHVESSLELINIAKAAARLHWTPGYVLLAKIYLHLAASINNDFYNENEIDILKNKYLNKAYSAVHMAEKIAEHSAASTHNATLNNSIPLTDGLPFTSWIGAKKYISGLRNGGIPSYTLDHIHAACKRKIDKIQMKIESGTAPEKYARLIN